MRILAQVIAHQTNLVIKKIQATTNKVSMSLSMMSRLVHSKWKVMNQAKEAHRICNELNAFKKYHSTKVPYHSKILTGKCMRKEALNQFTT